MREARNVNRENRPLIVVLAILAASVLLTGGLAVVLTLAREGGNPVDAPTEQADVDDDASEPRVAFTSDEEGYAATYVMDADGSDRQRVSGSDQGFCVYPSWSPDGQRMACLGAVEGNPLWQEGTEIGIWVSAADGSAHVHFSPAIPGVLEVPAAWSPDGTRLAFLAEGQSPDEGDSPNSVVHIALADGGVEQSIPLPWMVHQVDWSPTGDRLLLVNDTPESGSSVYVLPSQGGELTEVFRGGRTADWSPDGEEIVVAVDSTQIILIVGADQEPRGIAQLTGEFPIDVACSPDGAHIAVAATLVRQRDFATSLHIIALATGAVTTVVEGDEWLMWPNWSPDGNRLLFTMGPMQYRPEADLPYADLWVYDVTSGQLEQLTTGEGFAGMGVWSP
jgi:Tol biopolymer transport system component